MRYDLPAGGKRLVQAADGYVATIVARRGHLRARRGAPARCPAGSSAARRPAPDRTEERDDHDRPADARRRSNPRASGARDDLGDRYVFQLTDAHVAELDAALVHAEARADDVLDITRDAFPLPTLGAGARARSRTS